MLRGDEVGALLGAHILARGVAPGRPFANSIVSSRLLGAMARAQGVEHVETLTGFKWIGRVPDLAFGYEEALGYCVDSAHVRDKDGVSAALLLTELAATRKALGSDVQTVSTNSGDRARRLCHRLVLDPGQRFVADRGDHGHTARRTTARGRGQRRCPRRGPRPGVGRPCRRPEGLRYYLADDSRIIVRPSGTEPKLKIYLEVIEPVADAGDLREARGRAAYRLGAVRSGMEAATSL